MSADALPILPPAAWEEVVRRGLREDLGRGGDVTSDALIPAAHHSEGCLVVRRRGVLCGLDVALAAFTLLDAEVRAERVADEGSVVAAGEVVGRVRGATRSLLAAERTALNLLGRLSGIATATADLVRRVGDGGPRVVCTRKTTPGLRALEKYAVRVGGGLNHRFGLDDAVLIKDNHLAVAGSPAAAVRRARAAVGPQVFVQVEVDTLRQLESALEARPDAVLLDNMGLDDLRRAVEACRGRALTEASGGVTPETIAEVAATGVDRISVGWLTHSAPALDVGFDLDSVQ